MYVKTNKNITCLAYWVKNSGDLLKYIFVFIPTFTGVNGAWGGGVAWFRF